MDKDLQDVTGLTGNPVHLVNSVLWRETAYGPTS